MIEGKVRKLGSMEGDIITIKTKLTVSTDVLDWGAGINE